MIPRYTDPEVEEIWSEENKTRLWQETELAAVLARAQLGEIPWGVAVDIDNALRLNHIDLAWWHKKETELQHDYNAFVAERMRLLPPDLQAHFHQGLTSYDGEEPAFARMLSDSVTYVLVTLGTLIEGLDPIALRHRFTVMSGATHGQDAVLQSFGKRVITYKAELRQDYSYLNQAKANLRFSKMSGAVGNYGNISPELERRALEILGFEPFYGATQIMPRIIYAPVAHALCMIVGTLDKIALDIRLGARSGWPICQEPFGRMQTGSSTMPHKKNTIATEQMEGMWRLAQGDLLSLDENIPTWEERAIEQSCVERVAWPDLFHEAMRCLKVMNRVLSGIQVFPDNMLLRMVESRGCYASETAKEWLREHGLTFGLTSEEAYRIVQLAAFNAHEPEGELARIRENPPQTAEEMDEAFRRVSEMIRPQPVSIQHIIALGGLEVSAQLDIGEETVQRWNEALWRIFAAPGNYDGWQKIFLPSYHLRGEAVLYKEVIGA